MPCYHPMTGLRARKVNPDTGKRSVVFNPREGFTDLTVTFPCGQCIGCRLERSRQWAIRCVHEASLYPNNCFITLTYNNSTLPLLNSLNLDHFQRFMKRLRKRFGEGIRFFHCGEYGEQFQRPHYHACLFNFDFNDRVLFSERDGTRLYTSEALSELWPYGFSTIGDVSFESAAYVARYITKKITGVRAHNHYQVVDPTSGEILGHRKPEYVTMSRRPGIGKDWLNKYLSDVYPDDFIIIDGKKMKPPKFYDKSFEILNPDEYSLVRAQRKADAERRSADQTPERLAVREKVQESKLKTLVRSYENES